MAYLASPSAWSPLLPDKEQEYAWLLTTNLYLLAHYVDIFKVAVDLADYCDRERPGFMRADGTTPSREEQAANRQFIDWKKLAGRDAAITLGNYAETRSVIEKQVGRCPTILKRIDKKALARARKIYEAAFPSIDGARISVAHGGALFKSPEERAKHAVPGTKDVISIMTNRTMQVSHKGSGVLSVCSESLAQLEAATLEYFNGYRPVEAYLFRLHDEIGQGNRTRPE